MDRFVGIWLDQEKAFIVSIFDGKESINLIESGVEKRIRLSGGSRSKSPYGPQDVASEKKPEERRKHQLRRYYQEIRDAIEDAEKVLIFGPGEAKTGLEKEMKKTKQLPYKIIGVEPADKMTEKQILAKVRNTFVKSD